MCNCTEKVDTKTLYKTELKMKIKKSGKNILRSRYM